MRTLLMLTLLCLPLGAADMTVKQYQKEVRSSNRDRADAVKMYVMGIGQGIAWANAAAEKNNAPLYCQPPKFSMDGNNYIGILDKTIGTFESKTTAKELNEFPVGMLLFMGLQQAFPCQTAK
jgi:hypothetical protein